MKVYELDLEVTALGMVTSVGHDARTACAAIRAGISRPGPIHDHVTTDIADHESVPLLAHPVVPITNGFSSVGRWLQLCRYALRDLLEQLEPRSRARTAVYVWLPELDHPRFEHDDRTRPERMQEALVAPLISSDAVVLWPRGRSGLATLLAEVEHTLRSTAERVLILAVDSYVDAHALLWLDQHHHLKHDDNPVGLAPGEAAVAVCLEPGRHDSRSVRITRASEDHDEPSEPASGRALGRVLVELLDEHVGELYTDLNGEPWRAEARGLAFTALPPELARAVTVHHVAANIGDTGEVSALLNLGLAARSYQRDHARGRAAVVVANSDDGAVAAARLEGA
jgi:3-oxoacyl-[acyl-carrier-protein] synthase-1